MRRLLGSRFRVPKCLQSKLRVTSTYLWELFFSKTCECFLTSSTSGQPRIYDKVFPRRQVMQALQWFQLSEKKIHWVRLTSEPSSVFWSTVFNNQLKSLDFACDLMTLIRLLPDLGQRPNNYPQRVTCRSLLSLSWVQSLTIDYSVY